MKTKTLRLLFPKHSFAAAVLAMAALAPLWVAPVSATISVTNIYNIATNTTWTCPDGTTNVQVEVWGGGGGGGGCQGASNGRSAGGGGAGGYAKINLMPVAPGSNYSITISAAAAGGAATASSSSPGANGANVFFTGASNITVVAYGGNGGTNMTGGVSGGGGPALTAGGAVTNNVTVVAADVTHVGGAGVSAGNSLGGGGGSGPSDLGNGTNGATASGTFAGGAPGSDSIHNGGPGAGVQNQEGIGVNGKTPTSPPSGGGGGARESGATHYGAGGAGAVGQIILIYTTPSPDAVKANNADDLNLGSSWVSGRPPTSSGLGVWDSTVTNANTVSLGADTNWLGIVISNVGGAVTINGANTLGLGSAGIDMSGAAADLTLNCALNLLTNQSWNVANSRTLTIGGQVSGSANLTQPGSGTVKLTAANVLPSGSTYNLNAGLLDLNGNSQSISNLNGAGTVDTSVVGTPTITINQGTFSGVISNTVGTLSLTKAPGGTLTLSGNNAYSGVTTITGGSLSITNNNALGDTIGNTTIAATNVSGSAQLSLSGSITCPENITITGKTEGGTAVISAINNSNGTNTLGGNITLSSLTGGVRLLCGTGSQLIYSGTISQTGSTQPLIFQSTTSGMNIVNNAISNNGGDLVVLNNAGNAPIGALLLNAASGSGLGNALIQLSGTLRIGFDNALNTTGNLLIGQPSGNTTTNANYDRGRLDLNGHNLTVNALGGYANSATAINLNSARTVINSAAIASILTVGNGGGSDTFNGLISQTNGQISLTKVGVGTETLAGTNTYSGGTTINGGTLLLINTTGSGTGTGNVTVNSGGTLGGTGTIAGTVTNSGTLLSGTNGTGTLTINGNLILNAGSTNTFAVNGSTPTNTSVALGGNATYDGQLNIVPSGTFTAGQTFTLFSGAGATQASNFGNIVGSPGAGLAFTFTNGVLSVIASGGPTLSTNAYLTSLVVSNGAGALTFYPSAFTTNNFGVYLATNAYGAGGVTVTVTNGDLTATNTLFLNSSAQGALTSGIPSLALTLGVGLTSTVQVQVVSQDLSVTNTYTVNVYQQGPTLTGVTPGSVTGSSYPVTLTLNGSGLVAGCTALLTNTDSATGNSYATTFGSSSSVTVSFVPSTVAHNWNATVVNPDSSKTGQQAFTVTAPTAVSINKTNLKSAGAGNLVVSGTGGAAGNSYAVMSTTNLAAPIVWTPVVTNQFDGSGNFSYTNPVNAGTPKLFLRIAQ